MSMLFFLNMRERGQYKRADIYVFARHAIVQMFLVVVLLVMASGSAWPVNTGGKNYVLGVFPHLPPRELEKVYAPIAAALGKALGKQVEFGSSSTYERFMENLASETYDIIFTQPFDYIDAADNHGYLPLATRDEPLATIVVVQSGSALKSIHDLRGKTIALPPKVSAVSYLLRGYLENNGLVPGKDVTLIYHRSHVSCLQQVIIGAADACATAAPALRFFTHKMNVTLDIIVETTSIPHTLFAVHPRVSEQDRNKLLSTILSWKDTKDGKALLSRGKLKPFKAVKDSDYDVVRELSKNITVTE